jgi:hypothetical protein
MGQEMVGESLLELVDEMLLENRHHSARLQREAQTLEHFREMLLLRTRNDGNREPAAASPPEPGPAAADHGGTVGESWASMVPPQGDQTESDTFDQLVAALRRGDEPAQRQPGRRVDVSPPKEGSLRDQLLVILADADGPMSVGQLANIIEPGADKSKRTTVRSTLDRMKKFGEVVRVQPGVYQMTAA